MNKIRAVIFDIDGTLMHGISWTKLTEELGASKAEHERIHTATKSGQMGYEEARKALIAMWRNDGHLSRGKLTKIFESWELKDDAASLFSYLNSKGYITCLITGSMDLFAEVVAKKVCSDFWYANNNLIWDKDDNLHDFYYEPKQDEKKLKQFMEFCELNSIKPENCVTVGDDSNDIGLFQATGKGIAVESPTSAKVEHVAWKKVKDLKEIQQIL